MNKLSFPKLPNIKLPKTALLVSSAVAVVLGLTAYGMVRNVQAQRVEAAQASQAAEKQRAQSEAVRQHIAVLEADNKTLTAATSEKLQACAELRRLDAIRAITAQVTVPAYCLK